MIKKQLYSYKSRLNRTFYNNDGVIVNVINKPIEQFTIKNVLHKLKIMLADYDPAIRLDKSVFAGGPLANDLGFILHMPREGFGSSISIFPQTIITTSNDLLKTLGTAEQPENVLISHSTTSAGSMTSWSISCWKIPGLPPMPTAKFYSITIAAHWREAAKTMGINIHNITNQADDT